MTPRAARRRRLLAIVLRMAAAAVAVSLLKAGLTHAGAHPSLWVASVAAFALAKLAGDLTVLALFRDTVVIFVEDLFWELGGFVILGLVAAGLILLAGKLIGGPVEPYFPALAVYFAYLLAEHRQQPGLDRG